MRREFHVRICEGARVRFPRATRRLLGFVGTREEAEAIRDQLKVFLHDTLKLELSEEKTLITHAATQAARFLGYDIVTRYANDRHDQSGRRSLNGRIALRLPVDVLRAQVLRYQKDGKAAARPEMLHDEDYTIVTKYQAEYRGVVQYYLLADNVAWLQRLHWEMQTSLLRTLAWKHNANKAHKRVGVKALARKYRATVTTPYGPRKCLQVVVERKDGKPPLVAQFGGIPLRRKDDAVLTERAIQPYLIQQNELIKRLVAGECELCGSQDAIEVHHVRKLADLKRPGRKEKPVWMQVMIARQRKTLILCHNCHAAIQHGRPRRAAKSARITGEPDARKRGKSGSEGGQRKRAVPSSTSPVAYPTLTAVSWGLAAFSPCGTHLPADRLGFLARARVVYGVLDGDAAGRAAADRFGEQLGPRWRPLELPDGCDLNDLGQRPDGRAVFFRLLAEARAAHGGEGADGNDAEG